VEVTFGILGRTVLRIGGELQEDWAAPRVRAVLATLLVHAGQAVSIDTLTAWAWPREKPIPQDPVSTFHTYATRIRRCLQRIVYPSTLHTGNGSYRLDVDKSLIDLHQFRSLITQARAQVRGRDPERAAEYAERALRLWRGSPLDGLSSEPAQVWRRRIVQDEWIPANAVHLEALVAIEEFDHVLARLNELPAEFAYDVGLAKVRMSALYGLSRSAEATAYYFAARRSYLDLGDEQAADRLRQHHESLRVQSAAPIPAPQTEVGGPPRQLPHDVADFVGRADLLRALDTATAKPSGAPPGGVVILDGMPGVGKTALAVHWGHLVRHRFPEGDFFFNLNGFSANGMVSQSTVVDDLLIALGQPLDGHTSRSKELLLSRLMANRRALVVLDNARNRAHVEGLIALLPGCVVIVTSRQRLTTLSAATGARRVRVEPMPTAEATQLLSARLGADREIDPDDLTHLVELCGGLPLVIAVLAEQVATSGIARLSSFAERLDRRQLIAEVGEEDDGSSIAETFFGGSYQALAAPERRLFRLLGLHPGPDISVDVACAWDGRGPAETKRSFGILVGAHLLERPESFDRYSMHDLLRAFGEYCAEQDESPPDRRAAERRMASYYLTAAAQAHAVLYPGLLAAPGLPSEDGVEPVSFSSPGQARFWFEQERTNLIAAIQYTAARGHHDLAWRLADIVAAFLDRYASYEESKTIREIAVQSAAAASDPEAEASCRTGLGMVLVALGEHARARQCLEAGLRFAEETGNERGQASCLHQLGRLEMARGDPTAAVELYERCLELARRLDDHEALCWTHCRLGEALRALKEFDQALLHLHQTQFHAQHIGDTSAQAASLCEIGTVHRDLGDYNAAAAFCERALVVIEAAPDLDITAQVCTALAEINIDREDVTAARGYAQRALDLSRLRTHNATAEARAQDVLGDVNGAAGDHSAAVLDWRRAAELYERLGNPARSSAIRAKIDGSAPT
jgi:tetratricopeptide (TPR) repeat protein/DNA-binding SARP family transcriptional activator